MTAQHRIVIVDDDEGMRTLIRVNLEFDDRFEIAALLGSARELEAFLDGPDSVGIEVIVLDHSLPDADGVELVAELRRRLPASVRLVLYTGWSDPEVSALATARGVDRVVNKSVDPRLLLDDIAGWWHASAS